MRDCTRLLTLSPAPPRTCLRSAASEPVYPSPDTAAPLRPAQSPGDFQHAQHLAQSLFTGSPNASSRPTSPQSLTSPRPEW